jgi:hypothetical protein
MTNTNRFASLVLAAGLCATGALSGCSTTTRGDHGASVTYSKFDGKLTTTFEAPLEVTWTAAQAAIESVEFTTESKAKDATQAILKARTAAKSPVNVTIKRRSTNVSDVVIGVGSFGEEATAYMVLDKMKDELKKAGIAMESDDK